MKLDKIEIQMPESIKMNVVIEYLVRMVGAIESTNELIKDLTKKEISIPKHLKPKSIEELISKMIDIKIGDGNSGEMAFLISLIFSCYEKLDYLNQLIGLYIVYNKIESDESKEEALDILYNNMNEAGRVKQLRICEELINSYGNKNIIINNKKAFDKST